MLTIEQIRAAAEGTILLSAKIGFTILQPSVRIYRGKEVVHVVAVVERYQNGEAAIFILESRSWCYPGEFKLALAPPRRPRQHQ